ncbi:MAG TPA: hypothetical protein ENL20_06000 [Candidatus Cloacimonetes bacterium]|nr:hypothetical protein [Candidatus Cloacimonadota bacterium]
MRAMILAAGMGIRLGKITSEIPKPLVRIGENTCIIDTIVQKLKCVGIDRIAVNLFYHGKKIEEYLSENYPETHWRFFYEKELLNTGGGIANAGEFLQQDDQVIIINSDILIFFDLEEYIEIHRKSGAIASLLLVSDNPEKNAVYFDPQKGLSGFADSKGRILYELEKYISSKNEKGTFTGIHIFDKKFFNYLHEGKYSIIDVYTNLIKQKNKINVIPIGLDYWSDIGTPQRLKKARKIYSVLNSLEFSKKIKKAEKVFVGASNKIILRIIWENDLTEILMLSDDIMELNAWSSFSSFFRKSEFKVPSVLKQSENWLLIEDSGRKSLCDLVQESGLEHPHIKNIYQKSIEMLINLSKIDVNKFPVNACYPVRYFDLDNIKFDINLYNDFYLKKHLSEAEVNLIANEIYKELDKSPKSIMHRDFQSTNLLINNGKISVIDLQSMRIGYSIYDAASLLLDSNIPFNTEFIEEFREIYFQKMSYSSKHEKLFWIATFLRVIHDLGIFANIGKSKQYFKNKIKSAELRLDFIKQKCAEFLQSSTFLQNVDLKK